MKALKFGGTSMANAASIACVKDIVLSDEQAAFVVVSAPGKRESADTKVTDLLIGCYNAEGEEKRKIFGEVRRRYNSIIEELKIDIDLGGEFDEIEGRLDEVSYEYLVSRGEYFSAKMLASLIGYEFIDAAGFIKFSGKTFLADQTNAAAAAALLSGKKYVIPGFYGANEQGEVVTFSRGGSDISGAIIARAVGASVYENWTDVDGFMVCDPRVVRDPRIIDMLTYKELRELSYMGASVLHPESVFPVRVCNIPIHIKNTFRPGAPGTMIVPTKHFASGKYARPDRVITGIAGKKNFSGIYIEKQMMNGEVGFIKSLMDILFEYSIPLEHMPTGIDTVTLVIDTDAVGASTLSLAVEKIRSSTNPDSVEVSHGLAFIAIVGHGMLSSKGTAARVCGALSAADINIRMIDQGSSELNIIVAVENADYEGALRALYNEFEG